MVRIRHNLILIAFCLLSVRGFAAQPSYVAVVVRWADADTVIVKHCTGKRCREEKIRLRAFDAPELAHYKSEVDQPGGREALAFVNAKYGKGVSLIISPNGPKDFFGRIVADVSGADGKDVACTLARAGHGLPDPRYKPSAELKEAADKAACDDLGIWAGDENPIHPSEWRKQGKAKIIQLRKK